MFAKNVFIGGTVAMRGDVVARTAAKSGVIVRSITGDFYKGTFDANTNTVKAAKKVKVHYVMCIDREYVTKNGGLHWDSSKHLMKFDTIHDAFEHFETHHSKHAGCLSFEVRA